MVLRAWGLRRSRLWYKRMVIRLVISIFLLVKSAQAFEYTSKVCFNGVLVNIESSLYGFSAKLFFKWNFFSSFYIKFRTAFSLSF